MTPLLPRYTVGSLTGHRYMVKTRYVGEAGDYKRKPLTTWYVYDRLDCYRQIAYFHGFPTRMVPAWLMAHAKARKLERAHRKWLRRRGLL